MPKSELKNRIDALPKEKRYIFELAKAKKVYQKGCFSLVSDEDNAKVPDGVEDMFPLGSVQKGMLLHMLQGKKQGRPSDYHNLSTFQLKMETPFHFELFQKSVDRVVNNTPNMRTSFDMFTYSEPMQLVHSKVKLQATFEDLCHLSLEEKNKRVKAFIDTENRNLFDVSQAPLMRFHVQLIEPNQIQFSFTEPHSISDGWSTHLTLRDVFTCYFQLQKQSLPMLPVFQSCYRDFIRAERETLESADARQFWQEQVKRCVAVDFPHEVSVETQEEERQLGAHRVADLVPKEIVRDLYRCVEKTGFSFKSCLLAVHIKALNIISGQKSVTTGVHSNGRLEEQGGTQARGLFLNALPITFSLESGMTWASLIEQVYKTDVSLLPYRRFPLGEMKSWSQIGDLFHSHFSFLHFHSLDNNEYFESGEITHLGSVDHSVTNHELDVIFNLDFDDKYSLRLLIDVNLERFSPELAQRFLACYQALMADMARDLTGEVGERSISGLLNKEEQHFFAVELNDNAEDYSRGCIHQQFEAVVAAQGNAVAVEYEAEDKETRLSYRELNALANQVAHSLKDKYGVQVGQRVGLCTRPGPETLVGLLGILKCGATYVPLDPEYPLPRLAMMVRDAQVDIVLSQSSLIDVVQFESVRLLSLDKPFDAPVENLVLEQKAGSLAYILYTSGSTGQPKGVQVSHRSVMNYLSHVLKHYLTDTVQGSVVSTSLSFDATITGLLGPLMTGKVVHMLPAGQQMEGLKNKLMSSVSPWMFKLTPSHLKGIGYMLGQNKGSYSDVAHVLVLGGEALSHSLVRQWQSELLPKCRVINEYGPTEATVGCSWYEVTAEETGDNQIRDNATSVAIGRSIQNTQMYVFNSGQSVCPPDVVGELYIGGGGLADGYEGLPELSAERFIRNPFYCGEEGQSRRLYRTGDLGYYRQDGELVYLGRTDEQIKIRGYRIEPQEIQIQIEACDNVDGARVVKHGEELVGFVRPEAAVEDLGGWLSGLEAQVKQQLPSHMVPGRLFLVKQWPLTRNGKLDVRSLTELLQQESSEQRVEKFNTETELQLAEIWAELLNCSVSSIRPSDSFVSKGGHSLLIMKLNSTIREHFNIEMELADLLSMQQLQEQSLHIDYLQARSTQNDVGENPEDIVEMEW